MDAPAAHAQPAPVPSTPPVPSAYAAPTHAVPGYGAPYGWVPAPPPQNVLAWVSFGLAFAGLMLGPLSSIAGIVCGHIARRQIRERGEQGAGAALTGLIAGYAITALWVLGIVLYVLFIVAMIAFSTSTGSVYSTP
jgi:hypothetical protein